MCSEHTLARKQMLPRQPTARGEEMLRSSLLSSVLARSYSLVVLQTYFTT